MHVIHKQQQGGKLDAAPRQPEFRRLLHAILRIRTGIREPDHLGARRLRLHQEGGEIRRARKGRANLTNDAPASRTHKIRGIAFQRVAKGVIGGDEEPGIATRAHRRPTGGTRQHEGIIGPMKGIRAALRARQVSGG